MAEKVDLNVVSRESVAYDMAVHIAAVSNLGDASVGADGYRYAFLRLYYDCLRTTSGANPKPRD